MNESIGKKLLEKKFLFSLFCIYSACGDPKLRCRFVKCCGAKCENSDKELKRKSLGELKAKTSNCEKFFRLKKKKFTAFNRNPEIVKFTGDALGAQAQNLDGMFKLKSAQKFGDLAKAGKTSTAFKSYKEISDFAGA